MGRDESGFYVGSNMVCEVRMRMRHEGDADILYTSSQHMTPLSAVCTVWGCRRKEFSPLFFCSVFKIKGASCTNISIDRVAFSPSCVCKIKTVILKTCSWQFQGFAIGMAWSDVQREKTH